MKKGDRVKIINPELFVRCGYDLTINTLFDEIETEHSKEISKHVNEMCNLVGLDNLKLNAYLDLNELISNKIINSLAYSLLPSRMAEGSERKIFTEYGWQYKDKLGIIVKKKYVKTGIYHRGFSYDGDYEPAYLDPVQTNCILEVELCKWGFNILIEAKNVEQMKGNDND